ncbi:MAG: NERD domain-containing protein [Clostridia bacterium]|nr:NERD domain-containing protein [Clostridia bacterium]
MIFGKEKEPVILKENSTAEEQLIALMELSVMAKGKVKEDIEQEIRNIKAGIAGEENIIFELKNSHIPMYILRDIYIEYEDYKAQIDFIVVTKKLTFIIECKNLYGNIEIDNKGGFTRITEFDGKKKREGIYSPITQNERHIALLRKRNRDMMNPVSRVLAKLTGYNFDDYHKAVVVIANPKTVVNDKFATKDVKDKVIRADQLIEYINAANAKSKAVVSNDREMEDFAKMFIDMNKTNPTDYVKKYRDQVEATCPECGGELVLRSGKFGEFYGCSNYPQCKYTRNKPKE